ncbi:MAG: hypothetical protein K0R50_4145 [Eubacterium sp.]|jgi:AraC-like DNA-binding protein|nr:hypothetical protein [Eubacterium sp.]
MEIINNINGKDAFDFAHTRSDIINIDFHLHDAFEIYYLISGDVNYFVENKIYELKQGDIMITNKYEIHKPSFKSDRTYERIFIQFGSDIPSQYGSKEFDLLQCFNSRQKGTRNRIDLNVSQKEEFLMLLKKLEVCKLIKHPSDIIMRNTYFVQLLVLINNAFLDSREEDSHTGIASRLLPVLDYVNDNLSGDLSLESMEKKFFINKYYLSRLFKKNTGRNLHQYIIYKRLARAKELLAGGQSVTEACFMSGFNDYSNFYRLFKRIIGISPAEYKKLNTAGTSNYSDYS